MKYLYLLLSIVIVSCGRPKHYYSLAELKQRRQWIEKYAVAHKSETIFFAKRANTDALQKVIKEKWPDDTEYAYNVLKDSTGKVIMIYSSPMSESGDWSVEHTHYFDSDGNTFLFERHANAFNDCLPDGEVAFETVKQYCDADFKLIEKTDQLVDAKGKPLDTNKCAIDFATEEAVAYPNVDACLKAYHINI